MSRLFAFLISEENSFMTGSDVVSDGGARLEPPKMTKKAILGQQQESEDHKE